MPPGGDGKGNNFSASVLHLCTFLKLRCLIAKSCPTLLPPHGLSPTMVLCPGNFPGNNTGVGCISFWVSSWPRDWTLVSCIGRQILYHRATREAHIIRQSVELLKKMLCQYCFKAGRGLFVRPQSQDRAMPGAVCSMKECTICVWFLLLPISRDQPWHWKCNSSPGRELGLDVLASR